MTIKVLIKRKFSEIRENELKLLFLKMRSLATQQQGYIGGETLQRVDSPHEYLVISRWQRIDDWSRWLVSSERIEVQEQIESLTDSETKFEIYEQL